MNLDMRVEEIKNKLIKRSMEDLEKQVNENALLNVENYEHITRLSQY